jgi:cytochrome c oxidase cbb3-type subunit 3
MGMLPYGSSKKLSDEQLLQVASYVISKRGSNPAEPKEIDPAREVACPPAGDAPTASK